jgi:hypothetical protein
LERICEWIERNNPEAARRVARIRQQHFRKPTATRRVQQREGDDPDGSQKGSCNLMTPLRLRKIKGKWFFSFLETPRSRLFW